MNKGFLIEEKRPHESAKKHVSGQAQYIDDIIEGVYRCCYKPAHVDNSFDHLNPNQIRSNIASHIEVLKRDQR